MHQISKWKVYVYMYNYILCEEKIMKLKGSFNNVKSEIHGPTCYQCLWYGVILKP